MEEITAHIPDGFLKFLLVAVFSLLIGLEQRRHNKDEATETLFGTDRTFTLIGIAGFIFYVISPQTLLPYIIGGLVIGGLLTIYYFQKIKVQNRFGMTSLVTALITYGLAPLIYTQNKALVLLLVVTVLVITEIKENLKEFSSKFGNDEFISLAKFLVLAGVILPLLPDQPISDVINISPYKFWLAIVVISSISYFSYLLRKFIFPDSGILLTGLLGGLYSSTATTIIISKKSKEGIADNRVLGAMFLSLSMMFIRVFVLALFFNQAIAMLLLPKFAILLVITSLIALYFIKIKKAQKVTGKEAIAPSTHQNPLEFKTALLFGALFIVFAVVTQYVIKNFGNHGVSIMAFVVGITDINPFLINLFQGKLNIETAVIAAAVLNAITSNNIFQLFYALGLSDKSLRKELILSFGILIAAGIVCALV